MKSGWSLVIKICGGLLCIYFVGGLVYRFVYLHGSDIDLERFASYVSVAFLLLFGDRVMKWFFLRNIEETSPLFFNKGKVGERYENQKVYLTSLYGSLLLIVRWPLVIIIMELLNALWRQKWMDGFERLVLKLLGLESMTSTSSKLIFYSAWFLIGMLVLNYGFRLYWMRLDQQGPVMPD